MKTNPVIMDDTDAMRADSHCKDCCCAKSWKALGITQYDGKSIPEHIEQLKRSNAMLINSAQDFMDASEIAYQDLTDGQYGKISDSRSGKALKQALGGGAE